MTCLQVNSFVTRKRRRPSLPQLCAPNFMIVKFEAASKNVSKFNKINNAKNMSYNLPLHSISCDVVRSVFSTCQFTKTVSSLLLVLQSVISKGNFESWTAKDVEGNYHDLFEAIFCPIILLRVTAESHEVRQLTLRLLMSYIWSTYSWCF